MTDLTSFKPEFKPGDRVRIARLSPDPHFAWHTHVIGLEGVIEAANETDTTFAAAYFPMLNLADYVFVRTDLDGDSVTGHSPFRPEDLELIK